MQIAAHVLSFNVNSSLDHVLENIYPHVDKIFIAYSLKPFVYNKSLRESLLNPTSLDYVIKISKKYNAEIIKGEWLYEEDARNACFNSAKSQGFDWFITQDADEFYDEEGWNLILKQLQSSKNDFYFNTSWYEFWKSCEYVVLNKDKIKSQNANFALRCNNNLRFERKRLPNMTKPKIIDACCYHYGYVHSDKDMQMKIQSWSHANDIKVKNWYLKKWVKWNENTLNLNPTEPTRWKKAIKFPHKQPYFAKYFQKQIIIQDIDYLDKIINFSDNIKLETTEYLKSTLKKIHVKFK